MIDVPLLSHFRDFLALEELNQSKIYVKKHIEGWFRIIK